MTRERKEGRDGGERRRLMEVVVVRNGVKWTWGSPVFKERLPCPLSAVELSLQEVLLLPPKGWVQGLDVGSGLYGGTLFSKSH